MPNNPITLKGFQRKYLRALAHPLKPVVLIGQRGVTDELLKSLDEALNQHELIKLKFIENKNRADKARMLQTLQNAAHVHLVGTIGHTAIFYRPSSDQERQRIMLPQHSNDKTP